MDKECPFSGVTKSGRVWRKVPESDARSVQAVVLKLRQAFGNGNLDQQLHTYLPVGQLKLKFCCCYCC